MTAPLCVAYQPPFEALGVADPQRLGRGQGTRDASPWLRHDGLTFSLLGESGPGRPVPARHGHSMAG